MFKRSNNFLIVKIFATSLALWWGVILILPFNVFDTSSAYIAMSNVAPELAWGVFMLVLGSTHLLSIMYGFKRIEELSFLVATFVWIFIAAMFGLAHPMGTATGTYALIGILTGALFTKGKVGDKQYGR